jgi:hypothetical protein
MREISGPCINSDEEISIMSLFGWVANSQPGSTKTTFGPFGCLFKARSQDPRSHRPPLAWLQKNASGGYFWGPGWPGFPSRHLSVLRTQAPPPPHRRSTWAPPTEHWRSQGGRQGPWPPNITPKNF